MSAPKDPLTSRQAFWLSGLSATAGAAIAIISNGQVPQFVRAAFSGNVATWIGAIATFAAVIVALTAARKEREKSLEIQRREWEREEAAQWVRTRILAAAFSRELLNAAHQLRAVIASLDPADFNPPNRNMAVWLVGDRGLRPLTLVERFAGELSGFDNATALALLILIPEWRALADPLGIDPADLDAMNAPTIVVNMRTAALHLHSKVVDANDHLIHYVVQLPEIEGVVEEEFPEELASRIRAVVNQS